MSTRYEPEYKEYVSRMIVEEGRRPVDVSRELDVSIASIGRWVKDYKASVGWVEDHKQKKESQKTVVYKTPTDYDMELEEKDKIIEQIMRENRILKKAMHVFTENHE